MLIPFTGDMQVSLHGRRSLTIFENPFGRSLTILENLWRGLLRILKTSSSKGLEEIIYIHLKLKSCPSVCPSACHAVNSLMTIDIAISTTLHHKPIIPLLQVCHHELMQWPACVLQQVEGDEVEKI